MPAQSCPNLAMAWTVAHQAPPWLISSQECWRRLPFFPPGDRPYQGIEPMSVSPASQADSIPLNHQGSSKSLHKATFSLGNHTLGKGKVLSLTNCVKVNDLSFLGDKSWFICYLRGYTSGLILKHLETGEVKYFPCHHVLYIKWRCNLGCQGYWIGRKSNKGMFESYKEGSGHSENSAGCMNIGLIMLIKQKKGFLMTDDLQQTM